MLRQRSCNFSSCEKKKKMTEILPALIMDSLESHYHTRNSSTCPNDIPEEQVGPCTGPGPLLHTLQLKQLHPWINLNKTRGLNQAKSIDKHRLVKKPNRPVLHTHKKRRGKLHSLVFMWFNLTQVRTFPKLKSLRDERWGCLVATGRQSRSDGCNRGEMICKVLFNNWSCHSEKSLKQDTANMISNVGVGPPVHK